MGERLGVRLRATQGAAIAAFTALLLIVLVLAITFGSPVVRTTGRDRELPKYTLPPTPTTSAPQGVPPTLPPVNQTTPPWIAWVLLALLAATLLIVMVTLLTALYRVIRRRRPSPHVTPPPAHLSRPAMAVREDAAVHFAALREGEASEAIIRTWVALEHSVGRAGVERLPAETSTELTLRVLRRLDADHDAVQRLAALYREARYSQHALTDQDRADAVQALERVHASLAPNEGPEVH